MSSHLESLIASAQDLDASRCASAPTWDADRAARVREGVRGRRDARARRERALRRGLGVAGGAGLLVLALLRIASSAPSEPPASSASSSPAVTAEMVAARALGDAGYARD